MNGGAADGKDLHVAIVVATYLPESFGGAEQQCRKLSQALSRSGARVTILAPRLRPETPREEHNGSITVMRFRARKPPNLGGRNLGSLLLWSAAVMRWLWRHRHDIDVIHVFHGRLHALPAVLAAAVIGKPVLVKIGRGGAHFDLSLVGGKRLGGRLAYRALLRHTSGFIANSQEIVDDLLAHGISPDRILEVPNGVELPTLDASESPALPSDSQVSQYVYLGRLDPEKRLDLMLRGFARFSDHTARLSIVGDGDCRRELERLASDLGLDGRVIFVGRSDDISKHLRPAHFYLSTSASEGMSNALLEAMSFGLVPLVSSVSGARDIVTHGRNGLLFEPDDLGDFLAKLELLRELAAADYLAVSESARQSIRDRFSIEQIARQHLEIYRTASGPLAGVRDLTASRYDAATSG